MKLSFNYPFKLEDKEVNDQDQQILLVSANNCFISPHISSIQNRWNRALTIKALCIDSKCIFPKDVVNEITYLFNERSAHRYEHLWAIIVVVEWNQLLL